MVDYLQLMEWDQQMKFLKIFLIMPGYIVLWPWNEEILEIISCWSVSTNVGLGMNRDANCLFLSSLAPFCILHICLLSILTHWCVTFRESLVILRDQRDSSGVTCHTKGLAVTTRSRLSCCPLDQYIFVSFCALHLLLLPSSFLHLPSIPPKLEYIMCRYTSMDWTRNSMVLYGFVT